MGERDWTVFSIDRAKGRVQFNLWLAVVYVIVLAVLVGIAVRVWRWAL